MPKTTAHRLLGVLCRKGFARRIGIDYAIGDQLISLAGPGPRTIPGTRRIVLPYMIRLYELTRQTVNLAVSRGLEVTYIERVYGHTRVNSPSDDADRAPLHCTATGKVLLAFDNELNASFRDTGSMQKMTRRTLAGPAALDRELQMVRRNGLAYSREEFAEGVACAAAPVFGPDGRICMAVGVAGPSANSVTPEVAGMVRKTAHAISATIAKSIAGMAGRQKADGPGASLL